MIDPKDYDALEYRNYCYLRNIDLILNEIKNGCYEERNVKTETCGHIRFALYYPKKWDKESLLTPIFNFHGGGFVIGNYEQDGEVCQMIADRTKSVVINMDYPLAPEFKYPKPLYGSYEAIVKIMDKAKEFKIKKDQPILLGYSAGGAIAAALCLIDKEKKDIGIKGAILNYAPLYQTLNEKDRKALVPETAISPSRVAQYIKWYFESPKQLHEPLASPVLADLSGLPPQLVISAEFDSLIQEEKLFAEKAEKMGTKVTYISCLGCQHGFTHRGTSTYNPEGAEYAFMQMEKFILNLKENTK